MYRVRALPTKDHRAFYVYCDFLEGSDAKGCMIVLSGTFNNVTVNILRTQPNSESVNDTVNVEVPTFCYNKMYAFDIEYDGVIGKLAIFGQLTMGMSSMVPQCDINSSGKYTFEHFMHDFLHKPCSLESFRPNSTVAVVLSVIIVAAVVIVAFVSAIIIIRFKTCRSVIIQAVDLYGTIYISLHIRYAAGIRSVTSKSRKVEKRMSPLKM